MTKHQIYKRGTEERSGTLVEARLSPMLRATVVSGWGKWIRENGKFVRISKVKAKV